VSADPPGGQEALDVRGPNTDYGGKVELTPDGRTALYRAYASPGYRNEGLYKSFDGRTELVGTGPSSRAGMTCIPEHGFCDYLLSPDGRRVLFETPSSLVSEEVETCAWDDGFPTCIDIYERIGSVTTLLSTPDVTGDSAGAWLDSLSPDGTRLFFNLVAAAGFHRVSNGAWEQDGRNRSPFPSPDNQASAAWVHSAGGSADGQRVFFSTGDSLVPEDGDHDADVYQRMGDGTVKFVSTGPTSANEPFGAYFAGASLDGRKAFFATREKLVAEDMDRCLDGAGHPWGCTDVYERSSNGVTRLISAGSAGSGVQAEAVGIDPVEVSADGKHVFFVTDEPLVPTDSDSCPNDWGPGCPDVYESFEGTLRLVSTGPAAGNASHEAHLSGISRNGSHAFFQTQERLVDADTGGLYERAGGVTKLVAGGGAAFESVSDDGKRVFFSTSQSLLPDDRNCGWCPDVYERFGDGTTLISRGSTDCSGEFGYFPLCPAFAGISEDGRRAFFVSSESLVPEDTDDLNDLYVAIAPSRACRPDKPGHSPKKCAR